MQQALLINECYCRYFDYALFRYADAITIIPNAVSTMSISPFPIDGLSRACRRTAKRE